MKYKTVCYIVKLYRKYPLYFNDEDSEEVVVVKRGGFHIIPYSEIDRILVKEEPSNGRD